MTTQTAEQLLDWHTSQAKWHSRRDGKWHKSQARWHRKAIRRIPGVLGIIVQRTFRDHMPEMIANLTANNALLARLKKNAQGTKLVRVSDD